MVKAQITPGAYYDSVSLMIISNAVKKLEGVTEALVGMGTDLNRELNRNNPNLNSPEVEKTTPNDFFVAANVRDEEVWKAVLAKVDEKLNEKKEDAASNYYPATLEGALKIQPDTNMAVISVPGKGGHAYNVAKNCLMHHINVMLFSDNVSIEEEHELKSEAVKRGLLVMGPDCGTAIVNHVPLAFANVVRPGNIGMVCASGTGTQEVSSIIDQLGGGVSQVLGTGGRDLKKDIGGIMFKHCLEALIADPETKVIVLVSKPPYPLVQTEVLKMAKEGKKPTVVCFIGGDPVEIKSMGLIPAVSLEDAARKAVALSKGEEVTTFDGFDASPAEIDAIVNEATKNLASTQKYMRALYTGGTLCDESMKYLLPTCKRIFSNIPLQDNDKLENKDVSREHTALDFGDDEFTVGRPHPMIDPSLRAERVLKEANDETCAVILVDCVIGYGSHEDPAADLSDAIKKGKEDAKKAGRDVIVVASVCGTEGDPQCLSKTQEKLRNAGAIVMPTNAQACRLVKKIIEKIG